MKWVVQCKRWRGSVGKPVIRDFYGVVQHEKADKGIAITTERFTAPAERWAQGKPISLYNGAQLVEIWEKSKRHTHQSTVSVSQQSMGNDLRFTRHGFATPSSQAAANR